jgi:hypothetical protein
MKLDNIITPVDPPAILAEASQRKLGKYNVLGTWRAEIQISDFRTTMNGAPVGPPGDVVVGPGPSSFFAEHADWGEKDDGSGLRRGGLPVSIKLAINPDLAQEGDE